MRNSRRPSGEHETRSVAAFVESSSRSTTIKEGPLRKQGGRFKTWQRRLFVLTVNTHVGKYTAQQQFDAKSRSTVGLHEVPFELDADDDDDDPVMGWVTLQRDCPKARSSDHTERQFMASSFEFKK